MSSSCCNSSGSCDKKAIVWECIGCGYHNSAINKEIPPGKCPDCYINGDYFVQVEADIIPNLCL